MQLKQWKYFFSTELIKEVNSTQNGLIRVIRVLNKPRLMIAGMVQSGGLVKKIWSKAINKLSQEGKKIDRVLILGLGCGDCAFEVQQYYPRAQMVGVEIDEKVVEIAKCYFNLASVNNLRINVDDGVSYVQKLIKKRPVKKFDLIIMDVYVGRKMPINFMTKKIHRQLKRLLNSQGVIVTNHLFFGSYKKKAKEFIAKIDKIFDKISLQRTASNLLIFEYKK